MCSGSSAGLLGQEAINIGIGKILNDFLFAGAGRVDVLYVPLLGDEDVPDYVSAVQILVVSFFVNVSVY